jgi:hypothetical protein
LAGRVTGISLPSGLPTAGGMDMLSDQENHRLAEIEFNLRMSDPHFIVKLDRIKRRHLKPRPWFLRWKTRA